MYKVGRAYISVQGQRLTLTTRVVIVQALIIVQAVLYRYLLQRQSKWAEGHVRSVIKCDAIINKSYRDKR